MFEIVFIVFFVIVSVYLIIETACFPATVASIAYSIFESGDSAKSDDQEADDV